MLYSVRMRASTKDGAHVSGAEGIFEAREVRRAVDAYTRRAMAHSKGSPHEITVTVERITTRPLEVTALPVRTLRCASPKAADKLIAALLEALHVSPKAASSGLAAVRREQAMRGAALVDARTGRRLEPDRARGVRATMMGGTKASITSLSRKLSRRDINTETVKEALVLATKVSHAPGAVAELCVSDDPHYTTGYLASPALGYVRIPNIKKKGSRAGGRAVFLSPGTDTAAVVRYLETTPLLVTASSAVDGTVTLADIIAGRST
jgi:6-carboxyhexanoate--CoA ligase